MQRKLVYKLVAPETLRLGATRTIILHTLCFADKHNQGPFSRVLMPTRSCKLLLKQLLAGRLLTIYSRHSVFEKQQVDVRVSFPWLQLLVKHGPRSAWSLFLTIAPDNNLKVITRYHLYARKSMQMLPA